MYLSLPYEEQARLKEEMVYSLFEEAGISGFETLPIQSSPSAYAYRNKMEYTFGDNEKNGPTMLGMHKKGRSFDIVTVDKCMIVSEDFNRILSATLEYFRGLGIPHYNKKSHEGYLRFFIIRRGENTGELMINLVTSSQMNPDLSDYVDMLLSLNLEYNIVSILNTIDDNLADAVKCEELRVLHGRDHIFEEILGLRFKISPFSFFQTNTKGAEKLYSIAREFAGESKGRTIFDLYSGTGTIGQILSKRGRQGNRHRACGRGCGRGK
jgi:23S rRNA m(5)U-1939 methyltransferase (EC 2.1.1.-)